MNLMIHEIHDLLASRQTAASLVSCGSLDRWLRQLR